MEAIAWLLIGIILGSLIGAYRLSIIIIRYFMDNYKCSKDKAQIMLYDMIMNYK